MINLQRLQIYKTEAIVFVCLAGIAVLAYAFILQASSQIVYDKEVQWKEERSQMEKLLRRKKVEKDLGKFMSLLEDQQHYADAINRPMIIARKYHLNVPSVIYQKEKVEPNFLRVSFAFSLTGSYESIREFIAEIESEKSIYVIEDMNLGKASVEGNLLELQLKMTTLLKSNI
jgi:Tfp pilus assembly protein PilO